MIEKLLNKFGYIKDTTYKNQCRTITKLSDELRKMEGEMTVLAIKLKSVKPQKKVKEELDSEKLRKWAKRVKDRDKKCLVCGSTENLTAHHLLNKSHHPSVAYITEMGVCLCENCHNKFHNEYKNNCNPENFKKFLILNGKDVTLNSPVILWRA
jgi:5-methylcytosine-specific restriction endonuclease McrA